MKIEYNQFSLMRPGTAAHLLHPGEAQAAYNCKIHRGDLRSFNAPSDVEITDQATPVTMYQYTENSNTHWVVSDKVIHTVKSPIANEQYERLWYSGENELRFHSNDNISGGGFDPTTDYYKAGVPAPTTAPTIARVGSAGSEYRQYLYIFVNSYTDPGPNSPLSNAIADYLSGRVTVSGIESPPSGYAIDRIWVYRVNATGKETAEYQYVLEATYFSDSVNYSVGDFVVYSGSLYECTVEHTAAAWNAAHFTAGEQVSNANLGTVFEYKDYDPPPAGLKGLCMHPSGSAIGYVGNMLCMSVPNRLHAWPLDYRKSQPYAIRGLAIVGSNIFVLKDGPPSRYYGQHPDSMAPYHFTDWLPCLPDSERTISAFNGEVYYRTNGGTAKLNELSATMITTEQPGMRQIIDTDTWEADFIPLHGVFYKDLYFAWGASSAFFIDFPRRCCCWLTINALASAVSQIDGCLYLVISDNGTNKIIKWEGDKTALLQYTWRGRVEMLDYETNISHGLMVVDDGFYDTAVDVVPINQAIIAAGPLQGDLGGDDELGGDILLSGDNLVQSEGYTISSAIGFKVYGDNAEVGARTVDKSRAIVGFPPGWVASRLSMEITGFLPVLRAAMADGFDELLYG